MVPEMVEAQGCAGVDSKVDGKQAGQGWVGQAALRLYLILSLQISEKALKSNEIK